MIKYRISLKGDKYMDIFVAILLLIAGFVLIIKGGDWFVDSSIWFARIAGIPELIIGATIVSIGTTLPEFLTSLTSVIKGLQNAGELSGFTDLAIGNAVGSMMCNSGLILALVMLIKPPVTEGRTFAIRGIYVLAVSVLVAVFALTGSGLGVAEGVVLLVCFVVFMTINVLDAVKENKLNGDDMRKAEQKQEALRESKVKMIALFILGAAGIALGAVLLVDNAKVLCSAMKIPEQIVGITVVAIGTSLPELVTAMTSLKKGTSSIGVGNILGAHIINGTLILGTIATISGSGLAVDYITKTVACWVLIAIMSVLILPSVFFKKTTRWQGGIMLALYLGYMVYNVIYVIQQ